MSVRDEFDRSWPWLEAAMERYGKTHTKEQVWELIEGRKRFFWHDTDCAQVGVIWTYPSGLKICHSWLAGGDLEQIKNWVPRLEEHGRRNDCESVVIDGRRGWAKALGYHEKSARIIKKL